MKNNVTKKAVELMRNGYICDNCLGRGFAELLSGMSNQDRGRIIRHYIAFLIDSGEDLDVDSSNLIQIKFRNVKLDTNPMDECKICQNFFLESIDELAKKIVEKLSNYEYTTFLIGTVVSDDMNLREEKNWIKTGIEFVEPIRREINRELGKRVEILAGKTVDMNNPDIVILADIKTGSLTIQIKSIFIYGKYQKFVRGIPQSKWICKSCRGKGCVKCEGEGKLYKTSVQEIIEALLIKELKAKTSKFHGAGREDIDVRCLSKRPFVIEMVRPRIRKTNLRKIQSKINKSRKVNVSGLRFASKADIDEVKTSKYDKSYLAEVQFERKLELDKLAVIGKLKDSVIYQKTPRRVAHRRANLTRKRVLKKVEYNVLGDRKVSFKIKGESGLYIKELINGDDGRTTPNFSELLGNKVKSIKLDVIKIHQLQKGQSR